MKLFIKLDELRKKDTEQALLLEEKMGLQMKLLHTTNVYSGNEIDGDKIDRGDKEFPDYTRLVRNEGIDSIQLWQEVSYLFFCFRTEPEANAGWLFKLHKIIQIFPVFPLLKY